MKHATRKKDRKQAARGKCLSIYLDAQAQVRFGALVEANPAQDKNKLANMCILQGLPQVERLLAELYQVPPPAKAA